MQFNYHKSLSTSSSSTVLLLLLVSFQLAIFDVAQCRPAATTAQSPIRLRDSLLSQQLDSSESQQVIKALRLLDALDEAEKLEKELEDLDQYEHDLDILSEAMEQIDRKRKQQELADMVKSLEDTEDARRARRIADVLLKSDDDSSEEPLKFEADDEELLELLLKSEAFSRLDQSETVSDSTEENNNNIYSDEYDAEVAELLAEAVDDENPFVLNKEKLLNALERKNSHDEHQQTNEEEEEEENTQVTEKARATVGRMLRMGPRGAGTPKAEALRQPETKVEQQSEQQKSDDIPSSKLLTAVLVCSIAALVTSLVAIGAIGALIVSKKRRPRHLPLQSPGPHMPLFSPKDGLSTIYKNRGFQLPKMSKREAEDYKEICQQEDLRRQKEIESPVIDEAHYGANEFLNSSQASIM